MNPPVDDASGRRSFTLKSRRAVNTLRVFGVIDLLCSVPVTLAAVGLWIAFVVTAVGGGGLSELLRLALILSICGPLALWAGLAMLFNEVVLTRTYLVSGNSLRVLRRCPRDSVIAIDVRQHNLGRAPRAMAFAALRDGEAMHLMPLSKLLDKNGRQLEAQRAVVDDLRRALAVVGSNLNLADVSWPGSVGENDVQGGTQNAHR